MYERSVERGNIRTHVQGLCASLVPNILYNIYIYIRIYDEGEL